MQSKQSSEYRFDHKSFETILKNIITRSLGDENAPMIQSANEHSPCATFVVTNRVVGGNPPKSPTLIRSYPSDDSTPINCAIWQAMRASTAMPPLFKPLYIRESSEMFIDFALPPNPSRLALSEVTRLWKTNRACLVSIGNGRSSFVEALNIMGSLPIFMQDKSEEVGPGGSEQSITEADESFSSERAMTIRTIETARAVAHSSQLEDSETIHQDILKAASQIPNSQFPYFRFNALVNMPNLNLDEWDKARDVEDFTLRYLKDYKVIRELSRCAEDLMSNIIWM